MHIAKGPNYCLHIFTQEKWQKLPGTHFENDTARINWPQEAICFKCTKQKFNDRRCQRRQFNVSITTATDMHTAEKASPSHSCVTNSCHTVQPFATICIYHIFCLLNLNQLCSTKCTSIWQRSAKMHESIYTEAKLYCAALPTKCRLL